MEIEAKFVLDDPDIFQQLKTSQTLAGYTISTGKIKNVHDYYFDTSERLILQAGYACRIRDDGKKIKFTLKGLNKGKGIIHRREELEIELPDKLWSDKTWSVKACFDMSNKDLSLNDLPAGEIRDSFLQITHGDDLHLLFGLTQKRFVRIITDADRVVAEFSLDDVHVSVDGHEQTYFEVEIEQMSAGNETDLIELAKSLEHDWQLSPILNSKFERGLAFWDENKQ